MAINLTGLPVPFRGTASLPLFPVDSDKMDYVPQAREIGKVNLPTETAIAYKNIRLLLVAITATVACTHVCLFVQIVAKSTTMKSGVAGELVGKQIGWQVDPGQKINDYFPSFGEARKPTKWTRHSANSTVLFPCIWKSSSTWQSTEAAAWGRNRARTL